MQEQSKRIALNTVFLYFKMAITTVIGLYTGRVVLNTLGIDDFGIYNVVGGIVVLFGFLNASMGAATSRFITYELGRGSKGRLRDTFSAAYIVHLLIALAVLILCETIGVWILNYKLVIPADRMYAAHWVLQLSIVASAISITQVPYTACIFAYEHLHVFSIIEIVQSLLKLLIVFLLLIGEQDKLIFYAILTLAVQIVITLIYRIYCIRKFEECRHIDWRVDRKVLRPLLTFSAWDLYGNGCGTARQQGINFLINTYFGVALNAAAGIANVISGIVSGFTGSITQAFRPAIIKEYAAGDLYAMERLMARSMFFSLLLLSCMLVPLFLEADFVLQVWLGTVPPYAADFTRILLVTCIPNIVNAVIVTAVHANGTIKYMSFITGTIFLLNIPLLWLWLHYGGSPQSTFISAFAIMVLVTISNTSIAKFVIRELRLSYYYGFFLKAMILIAIAAVGTYALTHTLELGWIRLLCTTGLYLVSFGIITYTFGIDHNSRHALNNKIRNKICRNA